MRTLLATVVIALAPTAALAYVGPGAGLSLLGALWALIAAVGLAIAFVVAWPVRKMLRNRKKANGRSAVAERREAPSEAAAPRSGESPSRG